MIPGMNSRQAQQMMRKMGVQQKELDASEVIIILPDRKIVISNPSVSKVSMIWSSEYLIAATSMIRSVSVSNPVDSMSKQTKVSFFKCPIPILY